MKRLLSIPAPALSAAACAGTFTEVGGAVGADGRLSCMEATA